MPNLGDDTQGVDSFPNNGDRCIVSKFTATETGTIVSAHAYFDATGTAGSSCKFLFFNHAAGVPTTLIASSAGVAIPAGGGLVNFTLSGSFSAGDYYLGIVCNSFESRTSEDSGLTGQDFQRAEPYSYASPGAWPGTAASSTTVRLNVYITYSVTGVGIFYLRA